MTTFSEEFGYAAFHFRVALKQVSTLNQIFPDLYQSHHDWLIHEYRKKLGIRDKEHQKEVMNIINKDEPRTGYDDELHELESLNLGLAFHFPELKKQELNLPLPFSSDNLKLHSWAVRNFIGSSPDFLREMSLVFLISKFESFLKKVVSEALLGNEDRTTGQIVRTSIDKTQENILNEFGIDISNLVSSEEDWILLKERFYRRNLLVHHGNKPDNKYKELTQTTSDELLETNDEYLKKTFELFFDCTIKSFAFTLKSQSEPTSSAPKIPEWVRNTMQWYLDGKISEDEMISAIQYLVNEGIIKLK